MYIRKESEATAFCVTILVRFLRGRPVIQRLTVEWGGREEDCVCHTSYHIDIEDSHCTLEVDTGTLYKMMCN